MIEPSACAACEAPVTYAGRGRPRRYCTACVPPGTGGPAIAAWRRVNPGRVEAYNAHRREEYRSTAHRG